MAGARASTTAQRIVELPGLRVVEKPGRVEFVFDRWPRGVMGDFFADTLSTPKYQNQAEEFGKRARRALGRRLGTGGDKGRAVGLFRESPFAAGHVQLVAVMLLHVQPNRPLRIQRIDFAGRPERAVAQRYRRILIHCAENLSKNVSWMDGSVEMAARSSSEAAVLGDLGFEMPGGRAKRLSRLRGGVVLVRKP